MTTLNNKTIPWKRIILSVIVWAFCLIWFFPIIWMFITSLKPSMLATSERIPTLFPKEASLDNYRYLTQASNGGMSWIARGFLNSIWVAFMSVVLGFVTAIPAAYALSRLRFKGRQVIFIAYVVILAFPGQIFMIPHFYLVHKLGLIDTFSAMIVPGLGVTFGVFMLRQFMMGISKDMEDAAWIDGCSKLRFLWVVVMPFIRPFLLVQGILGFIGSWNNFLWALLVLNDPDKMTLPIALVRFTAGWGDPFKGIGVLMSGAFLSVAPILIMFIIFHRVLLQGISLGSVDK